MFGKIQSSGGYYKVGTSIGPGGQWARSALMLAILCLPSLITGGPYMLMCSLPAAALAYGMSKLVPKNDTGVSVRAAGSAIYLTVNLMLPFLIAFFADEGVKCPIYSTECLSSGLNGLGGGTFVLGLALAILAPIAIACPPAALLYYMLLPLNVQRKAAATH